MESYEVEIGGKVIPGLFYFVGKGRKEFSHHFQ